MEIAVAVMVLLVSDRIISDCVVEICVRWLEYNRKRWKITKNYDLLLEKEKKIKKS